MRFNSLSSLQTLKVLIFHASLVATCSFAQTASFDCTKALSFAEKTVCSNPVLGKLDTALAVNYQRMLASNIGNGASKDLRLTQKRWLTERNQCKTAQCLENAYRKRVDEVCEYPVISGIHAICIASDDIK
jgi:uncharacterized protein